MTETKRRDFLKTAGVATAAGVMIQNTAMSQNDKLRVGVVGVRGRGRSHISGFSGLSDRNVEVTAFCDVDENVLAERKAEYIDKEIVPSSLKTYTDIQDMLDSGEIDIVSIATPNHWHSLQGIWSCQAGKDVYVEKPLSHNVYEGRKLVEAARKYNRMVQHGTQIRSSAAIREAMEMLKEGEIGEVYYAKGTCYKWRNTIGNAPVKPVPEGVHYDSWLGPAPEREFTDNRFHYDWHWHWDYGNGDIGNQGVHQMDVCRWGLDVQLPDMCQALGGHFMFEDDQETPNTLVASFKFSDVNKMMVFEVRHWITNDELMQDSTGNVVGCLFLGSEGIMIIPSYSKYEVYYGRQRDPGPSRSEGGNHYANFIDAVRSRNYKDLHADVEEGHLSSALCHYANAAYVAEETLRIDTQTEQVTNSEVGNDIVMGKARDYRSPFTIPDNI